MTDFLTCFPERIFLIWNLLLNNIEIKEPINIPKFRILLPQAVTGAIFKAEAVVP